MICLQRSSSKYVSASTTRLCAILYRCSFLSRYTTLGWTHTSLKTCKTLYDITNSRYFWETLRYDLQSKPGIREPLFELMSDQSLGELKRHTWDMLRVYDKWSDPSPPQFRISTINSGYQWDDFEVLPGGKWLFGVVCPGHGCIIDLNVKQPMHHFLFEEFHESLFAHRCRISLLEGRQSSFRVALFDDLCKRDRTSIHLQISCITPHRPVVCRSNTHSYLSG